MTQQHENHGEKETSQSVETVVKFILRLSEKVKFIFI